jgi:hypothetical protein
MSSKKDTTDPTPTGKQIRKALIDLDLTVMDLAREMSVSPIYIRFIYQERRAARRLRKLIASFLHDQYQRQGQRVPRAFNQTSKEKAA